MTDTKERRLSAVLVADVVGYTKLVEEDTDGTVAAWTAARANVIEPVIGEHSGHIVKFTGDGFLAEFSSIQGAIVCAINLQRGLRASQLVFRVGISLSDVIDDGTDIHGEGVNIAARIETLAEPGGICVSGDVYNQVRNRVDADFKDMGEHAVKHVSSPVRVYSWIDVTSDTIPDKANQGDVPALPDKPSIAVLPFTNMSGDADQEFFSDGITEDIITELSRFNSLFVIARNSTFSYKNKSVKVQEIGQELGVGYVVEGSVRKAANRVRITVQLVNAATGNHVWAERYDRELTDIFLIQDEITQSIVGTLAITLEDQTLERTKSKNLEDLRVYEHWIRGKKFLWSSGQKNRKANQHFEKAISLDSEFAHGHAGLAVTYIMAALDSPNSPDFLVNQQKAFESAQMALSLDSTAYQAHLSLAWVYLYRNDYERLKKHLDLALALNPNDADTLANASYLLTAFGEPEKAAGLGEAAFRLNPRHPDWYVPYYAWALFNSRRYEDSLEIRLQQPEVFFESRFCGAATLALLGRIDEARNWVKIGMTDMALRPVGSALPNQNIIQLILDNNPLSRQEDREHYERGLRLAGVKE